MRKTKLILISCTFWVFFLKLPAATPPLGSQDRDLLIAPSMEQTFPELVAIYDQVANSSKTLQRSSLRLEQARLGQGIARSNLYPRISAGVNFGANQFRPQGEQTSTSMGINYNLALSQSLYQWGALKARREIGRIDHQRAQLNEEIQLQNIAQQVRELFSQLVLDKVQLQADSLDSYIQQQRMDFVRRDFEGERLGADEYEARLLEHRQQQLRIEQRKQDVEQRVRRFNDLLGVENITLEQIPDVYPEIELKDQWVMGLRQLLNQGEATGEILRERIALSREHQKLRMDETRAFQRPHLSIFMSAGQGRTNTSRQDNVAQIILFAGLSVNWNIFDGFSSRNQRLQRLNEGRLQEISIWNQLRNLERESMELMRRLDFGLKRLETAERLFALERRRFENSIRQAEEGRLSDLDFAGVRLALLNQEYNLYQERRNFQVLWGEILIALRMDPALETFARHVDGL